MKIKHFIALTLVMVMTLAVLPAGTPALADRAPSPWAAPEMNAANISGLLTPSAARDFRSPLTRDEFCELVVVMVELTLGRALPVPPNNPFVDDTEPISIHALKAWHYGIITGMTPTLFSPRLKVERQQLCAMMIRAIRGLEGDLNRTLLSPGIASLPYRDAAQIRDYAIEPVRLAYSNVIMQGNEQNYFMPASDITSQECVAVIIRSFNRIEAARVPSMSTAQLLELASGRVHIGYAYGDSEYGVTQNIALPTTSTGGATVSWQSSNNGIIRASGSTGVVIVGNAAQTVTLTATIRIGSSSTTKSFTLTTSPNTGDRLLLENAYNELDILYINDGDGGGTVTGRIGLPTTVQGLPVTWQTSNANIVNIEGIVSVPNGSETRSVRLTATIRLGSQSRTKNFDLTVVNPSYSRGVTLHGVQLGMTQAQITQTLGASQSTINAGNNETWQIFHASNYSNFIAVAFISDRAAAIYSMAPNVANQLRNRSGTVITVAEAGSMGGVGAVSYIDPGNSSQQYAIMIFDSTSAIGGARSLNADGQEQLLFYLVNAFRQRNSRSILEWSAKLGTPARAHSNNGGSGNLQQRVTSGGFDSARYAGGNVIPGNGDAFDAFDQIVSNSTGSSSMRSAILQQNITYFGAGFSGGNSGSFRTYFTYALGDVTAISNVTARQNDVNVATVNVSTGAANAMTVTLIMAPSGFNESITVTSSNTGIMTVTGFTATNNGGTVTVTGVANGSANIVITGNCSGKSVTVPVSVGTVFASALTLSYSGTGSAVNISTSANINANTNAAQNGTKILVMGTGETITIAASASPGATVEWARTGGNAATVARSNTNNNGVVTAGNNAGTITLTARVRTGNNTWITHTITVCVVSVPAITLNPTTAIVSVGSDITASVNVTGIPNSGTQPAPVYSWAASGNALSRAVPATETATAVFRGANQGTSTLTFTATWSGSSSYLGRITKQISVTVQGQPYVDSIAITPSGTIRLIPGQQLAVTAAITPSTITQNYTLVWESGDDSIVTVTGGSSNGATLRALRPGSGDIVMRAIARHADGMERPVEFKVNVGPYPVISISNPVATVNVDSAMFALNCSTTGAAPDDLPAAYRIEWVYDGTGASVGNVDGIWVFAPSPTEPGSGTVTVNLYFKDHLGAESIVSTAHFTITIT